MEKKRQTSFPARLAKARNQLGLSQIKLAKAAGISTKTQISYEKGATRPSVDYLTVLATLGVDINYLLTGQHGNIRLGEEEDRLLRGYGKLPDDIKMAIKILLAALPEAGSGTKNNISNSNINNSFVHQS